MKIFKSKRNRVAFYIIIVSLLFLLLPSAILKIYVNSDAFKERLYEEINKRGRFHNLSFHYQIGDIGLFTGIEFLRISLKDKNRDVIELQNCYLSDVY
ncbi:MAG: hypothetical protein ACPL7I_10295, partial [Myxococcota bacterium]